MIPKMTLTQEVKNANSPFKKESINNLPQAAVKMMRRNNLLFKSVDSK
jgi:hypothetical protein